MTRLLTVVILGVLALPSHAGVFVFALDQNRIVAQSDPDLVAHSSNYNGSSTSTVKVCIDPQSPNASAMVVPLQNAVERFNSLVPVIGNIRNSGDNEIPFSQFDFESVLIHELGHCVGLAHPNIAGGGNDDEFTTADLGANGTLNLNSGPDGVDGSPDDVRGDDGNYHWFEVNVNNPYLVGTDVVDRSTFSNDLSDLPPGHNFPASGDRDVAAQFYGFSDTESVMNQGTFNSKTQRGLGADDVATLRLAQSGFDGIAGTADDYSRTVTAAALGDESNCDITLTQNTSTGFAFCSFNGSFNGSDNIVIGQGTGVFNPTIDFFYTSVRIPAPVADSGSVARGGSTNTVNGGQTSVLTNDSHPQSAPMAVDSGTFGGPFSGTVTLNSNGSFNYQHDGSASTSDWFVYRVCTQGFACAHEVVTISVGAGNAAPVAVNDQIEVDRGGSTSVLLGGGNNLLANDSDPDSDPLTLQSQPIIAPSEGSVTLNSNGTFTYSHDSGSLALTDTFRYRVCDTSAACDEADVTVAIDGSGIFVNSTDQAIPDADPNGVDSVITVGNIGIVGSVNVGVTIDHTFVGDLRITLTHENSGASVVLMDRPGDPGIACSENDVEVVFSDSASPSATVEDMCRNPPPAISGVVLPQQALADFAGLGAVGDWTLNIADFAGADVGTLLDWQLSIQIDPDADIVFQSGFEVLVIPR